MDDHYAYWESPPPKPSPKLAKWTRKIQGGWEPNARIRSMGRDACSRYYDVYQWEYLHVIAPLVDPEAGRSQHWWDGAKWVVHAGERS